MRGFIAALCLGLAGFLRTLHRLQYLGLAAPAGDQGRVQLTGIGEGRQKVGEVSKKWFRLRDTYGVEVAEGQDDVIILAVTVAIDIMAHPTR